MNLTPGSHELQNTPQGSRRSNSIRIQGPLAWLWRKLLGENVAAGIPQQLQALARRASAKDA